MITTTPALTLLVGFVLVPAQASSQARPLAPPAGDPVVQEVRLLRQAVERQAASSARVQLLVGRLAVSDQRVARTQDAAERLEGEALDFEQRRRRMDAEVRELTQSFEQAADDARRAELQDKLRQARTRTVEHTSAAAQLETRRSRARQDAAAEQARYQELEAKLSDLERELSPPR